MVDAGRAAPDRDAGAAVGNKAVCQVKARVSGARHLNPLVYGERDHRVANIGETTSLQPHGVVVYLLDGDIVERAHEEPNRGGDPHARRAVEDVRVSDVKLFGGGVL